MHRTFVFGVSSPAEFGLETPAPLAGGTSVKVGGKVLLREAGQLRRGAALRDLCDKRSCCGGTRRNWYGRHHNWKRHRRFQWRP